MTHSLKLSRFLSLLVLLIAGFCTLSATELDRALMPGNDECGSATLILVNAPQTCTSVGAGTLNAATASPGPVACLGTANNDVWFRFTAGATGTTIRLTNILGGDSDFVHEVYSGTCDNLTRISCSDPNTSTLFNLTVGAAYYIRVFTFENLPAATTFNVCVQLPSPPPDNDDCGAAFPLLLSENSTCTAGFNATTFGATRGPETNVCSTANDDDVWFRFVAPTTDPYLFELSNFEQQTYVHVYSGVCGGNLTRIGNCLATTSSRVDLVAGQTYLVQIHTASPSLRTNFRLCARRIVPPPINDDCIDAVNVFMGNNPGCDNTVRGSLEGATSSGNNARCTGTENNDVWYSFLATSSAVDISILRVRGNIRDIVHSVYTGTCNNLTQLACTDNPDNSTLAGLNVGQRYYVRINTWSSAGGATTTFDLCLSQSAASLPVEFADFTGESRTKNNLLEWTTASEANTEFHVLERANPQDNSWKSLVTLEAAGESDRAITYQAVDESPLPSSIYRIRSIDFDGTESVSNTLQLERKQTDLFLQSVQPNPVTTDLRVSYLAVEGTEVSYRIFNSVGQSVLQRRIPIGQANGTVDIPMAHLPAGAYFLELSDGKQRLTRRVIKR
ncbi:T9SS type A sorting domain-containing protein [Lewinella sp. 4G2]|uniref:T9SS type A sorting domain-containing protein n=1 Tax=Lewinella sp. 4G2 TaxID=1803372 RepID=UPI0007E11ACA|nr:T9SS type A sorting domain-containing protein [Lewinella sp. 4G2]OAV45613.1 hypothetical protein A3850_014420 [Lewinella sp. 4G2]